MEAEEYDYLLKRSDDHVITRAQLDAAAAELANPQRKGSAGKLMAVLRRDRTRSYESLFAPFLDGPDYLAANDALVFICLEYGQTARYTDYILRFMQGVPYDRNNLLRSTAVSIAGDYLNSARDPDLLLEIIQIAQNETDERMRVRAYEALFEALGYNGPPYGEHIDPNIERERNYEELGPGIVREAKQRLEDEENQKSNVD